jgi:hypothetical protein
MESNRDCFECQRSPAPRLDWGGGDVDKLGVPLEIRERAACASLLTRWIAGWLTGCATTGTGTARGGRGIGEEAGMVFDRAMGWSTMVVRERGVLTCLEALILIHSKVVSPPTG